MNKSRDPLLKVWKKGRPSLKVRQRKAELYREKKNAVTMQKLEQKWEDIKRSFTDQAPTAYNSTSGNSIVKLNQDISIRRTGQLEYQSFDDTLLLSFDSPNDVNLEEEDFSVYPDFEELYEQLKPQHQWYLLEHEGTVHEIYEECKRLHAKTVTPPQTEHVSPVVSETVIESKSIPMPRSPEYHPETTPVVSAICSKKFPTLSQPIFKSNGGFVINGNNFTASSKKAIFSEHFGFDSILIYAGPGNGKTFFIEQYKAFSHIFADTDDLSYGVDGKQVILTNRPDLLLKNKQLLTIAFLPPRVIWDSRCFSKCGKRWQPNWYPIDEVQHAHIVFTGTGYLSDYFIIA